MCDVHTVWYILYLDDIYSLIVFLRAKILHENNHDKYSIPAAATNGLKTDF